LPIFPEVDVSTNSPQGQTVKVKRKSRATPQALQASVNMLQFMTVQLEKY